MPVLTTKRLTLRPFTLDDFDVHAALYADPDVTRWLSDGPFIGFRLALTPGARP